MRPRCGRKQRKKTTGTVRSKFKSKCKLGNEKHGMLPHLISKLCEYRYSTVEHRLNLKIMPLLILTVSFQEKLENDIRNKGRYVTSDWLLKQAIAPFNHSDFWAKFSLDRFT